MSIEALRKFAIKSIVFMYENLMEKRQEAMLPIQDYDSFYGMDSIMRFYGYNMVFYGLGADSSVTQDTWPNTFYDMNVNDQ